MQKVQTNIPWIFICTAAAWKYVVYIPVYNPLYTSDKEQWNRKWLFHQPGIWYSDCLDLYFYPYRNQFSITSRGFTGPNLRLHRLVQLKQVDENKVNQSHLSPCSATYLCGIKSRKPAVGCNRRSVQAPGKSYQTPGFKKSTVKLLVAYLGALYIMQDLTTHSRFLFFEPSSICPML